MGLRRRKMVRWCVRRCARFGPATGGRAGL